MCLGICACARVCERERGREREQVNWVLCPVNQYGYTRAKRKRQREVCFIITQIFFKAYNSYEFLKMEEALLYSKYY